MSKALKGRMVTELESCFSGKNAVMFVEYHGIPSNDANQLRRELSKSGIELRVVKNSLASKALKTLEMGAGDGLLAGPTAVAVGGEDAAALAKAVSSIEGKYKGVKIKGGVLEGRALTSPEVKKLAKLPPREVLLAQVLACLQSPLERVAGVVSDVLGKVARLLAAGRDAKKQEEGAAQP